MANHGQMTTETQMTTTETKTPKTRTITLTGRAPVKIREDEWPEIASAKGDSCTSAQFRPDYEIDEYAIRVRQHADGRTIVYALLNAAIADWHQPAGGESQRGGYLLTPEGEGELTADDGRVVPGSVIADAIKRVGRECNIPDSVVRECIADLPAEEI